MISKHYPALLDWGLTTTRAPFHLSRLGHFPSRQLCYAFLLPSLWNLSSTSSRVTLFSNGHNAFFAFVMTAKVLSFFSESPVEDWIVWVWPEFPSVLLARLYNPQPQSQLPPTLRCHKAVLCGNTFIFISPYLAASGFVLSFIRLTN